MNNQLYSQVRMQPYPDQIQSGIYKSKTLPSTNNDNQELLRVRASRILDFFPDELVIQNKTVSVIKNELLATYVETMPVRDIEEVVLSKAGPFAALTIRGKNLRDELIIKNLPAEKAKHAKAIIDTLL